MISMPTESEPVKIVAADALAFLRGLPDDSVDLVFTSPPYLEARTYGINAGRKLEPWVKWMVEIVTECVRVCKGLTAVVCEGQTRNYQYLPAPFLLAADLHRAGFNLRKPVVFHRVGIPGSGGPDWLRNDWEPVVCVSREGKLPWSDNTVCGHPPTYSPGGPFSYRMRNGERKNGRMVYRITASDGYKNGDMQTKETDYSPPDLANPGNVVKCDTGGGRMGHMLAHENEGPFPLDLPTFFVRSFAPPGGVVCDPFAGSGTTAHASIEHGRNFVGCDIRQSQVDLTLRRLATVTPSLFAGAP